MKAPGWSCVLGLLCMPAEVILSPRTVSQETLSSSLIRVNSSVEITCSTSLSDPMGLYLKRRFHSITDIVYLSLTNGQVTKNIIAPDYTGRIHVAPDQQIRGGYEFTLQLSLLGLEDTDLYYCSWRYFNLKTTSPEYLSSNATIIIVGGEERDPQEQCQYHILDHIFIALSVTAFTVVLSLFIGALIVKCKQYKKKFRPARAIKPSRSNRPQHVCTHQRGEDWPYLTPYANTLDYRGNM